MKEKPTRLRRRLDPDNPLVESLNFRLSQRMLDAINRLRDGAEGMPVGRRTVGVVVRKLISWALEHKE